MFDVEALEEYRTIMARLSPEQRVEFARWASDLARQFEEYAGKLMPVLSPGTVEDKRG
jgi:hypothetical protein